MTDLEMEVMTQAAYDWYFTYLEGQDETGRPLADWGDLSLRMQTGWRCAILRVCELLGAVETPPTCTPPSAANERRPPDDVPTL